MIYYLYEIKNNVNGKIYIGVHRTNDLNDGYMGSGSLLNRAKEKYGIENFSKTILQTFDNEEQMFQKEREIVNETFLLRDDVYNLKLGGDGGWDFINSDDTIRKERSERTKGSGNSFFGKTHSQEVKQKLAECATKQWSGVKKTEDHKLKISKALTGVPLSEERKKNISLAKKGKPAWNKGKTLPKVKCPHCAKEGDSSNMKRWHFDNCKYRID